MFFIKRVKKTYTCVICGKSFEARQPALTCSNACRMRLSRNRRLSRNVVEKIRGRQ